MKEAAPPGVAAQVKLTLLQVPKSVTDSRKSETVSARSGEAHSQPSAVNLLVHRIVPPRIVELSTLPDRIELDLWFHGDVSRIYSGRGLPEPKEVFALDANCLVREGDWIGGILDGLAEELTDLASGNGLG